VEWILLLDSYLVEVNVHALELKVGGAVVASVCEQATMINMTLEEPVGHSHSGTVKTVLTRDGLPVCWSVLMSLNRAAAI